MQVLAPGAMHRAPKIQVLAILFYSRGMLFLLPVLTHSTRAYTFYSRGILFLLPGLFVLTPWGYFFCFQGFLRSGNALP